MLHTMLLLVIFICLGFFSCLSGALDSAGYLTVNSKKITENGTHVYHYFEGEAAYFTCSNLDSGTARISYKNKAKKYMNTGSQAISSVNFYMKMRKTSNEDTELTCRLFFNEKFIDIKTLFRQTDPPAFRFEINELVPRTRIMGNEDVYEYQYFNAENINIKLVKNEELHGNVTCEMDTQTSMNIVKNLNRDLQTNFQSHESNTGLKLYCVAQDSKKSKISIKFVFNNQNFTMEPKVDRLAKANILTMYSNETSSEIQYEYQNNEELHFTCIYTDHKTKWMDAHNNTILGVTGDLIVTRKKEKITKFRLRAERNKTVIQCVDAENLNAKVTSIEIIRKPLLSPTVVHTASTTGNMYLALPIGGIAALLLIVAGFWMITRLTKNRKRKERAQNMDPTSNYQSLPGHMEGPMATPTQWDYEDDDVTYAMPESLDIMYAQPVPKNQRPKPPQEYPAYYRPHDVMPEPTYASVEENESLNRLNKNFKYPQKLQPIDVPATFTTRPKENNTNLVQNGYSNGYVGIPTNEYAEPNIFGNN